MERSKWKRHRCTNVSESKIFHFILLLLYCVTWCHLVCVCAFFNAFCHSSSRAVNERHLEEPLKEFKVFFSELSHKHPVILHKLHFRKNYGERTTTKNGSNTTRNRTLFKFICHNLIQLIILIAFTLLEGIKGRPAFIYIQLSVLFCRCDFETS